MRGSSKGVVSEANGHLGGDVFRVPHTIGDPDPAKPGSSDKESSRRLECLLDSAKSPRVADLEDRVGFFPAEHGRKQGRTVQPHELLQLRAHDLPQLVVPPAEWLLAPLSPEKATDQQGPSGRSSGELLGGPGAGEDAPALAAGDDEAGAIQSDR